MHILEDAGWFLWPLLVCSFLALVISIERLIALRPGKVVPARDWDTLMAGQIPEADDSHALGRLIAYHQQVGGQVDQIKAYVRFLALRMERGLFLLDVVVSAAPLLGLMGTVTGLIKVFSRITPESGLPDPTAFVEGVAMALTTTLIGLAIAIPTLAFSSWLYRRVDTLAARLEICSEQLCQVAPSKPTGPQSR